MVLNRIWIGMFLVGGIVGFIKLIFWQDVAILGTIVDSMFSAAKIGFEIALFMTAMLCFWMGIMKIGENGGAVNWLTKIVSPFFSRIFPGVPKDHPANGAMMMNISANMLGLDNAATPLGLKAMNDLQELNPEKERASDAQIMFLVLNTSGLTIIPVSVFAVLSAQGSLSPTNVFLPILISTYFATLAGLIIVGIRQKINLFHPIVLAYLGTLTLFILSLLIYVAYNPHHTELISNVGGNGLILLIILSFILLAMKRKVNVYDSFIDGAKEGFTVAIRIIPYLIAMLCAMAVLRSSGTLDAILYGIRETAIYVGITATEWIDALPVAFMKPLSGSAARGAFVEIISQFGVDSLQAKIAATMQGSTETTLYVLAVYFGSVGIKNTRYAAAAGLLCDLIGIIAAIIVAYIFFGNG